MRVCRHRDRKIGPAPFLSGCGCVGKTCPSRAKSAKAPDSVLLAAAKCSYVRTESASFVYIREIYQQLGEGYELDGPIRVAALGPSHTINPDLLQLWLHPAHPSDIACIPVCFPCSISKSLCRIGFISSKTTDLEDVRKTVLAASVFLSNRATVVLSATQFPTCFVHVWVSTNRRQES